MGSSPQVPEITLSAAWHAGAVPARLVTTDGVSLEIVHRGTWSHGLGPDFRDALILFDGRDGAIVPVADIGPVDRFVVPEFAAWDWQSVGGATCAPRLAASSPTSARDVLHHLGDVRLAARSARLEGRLSAESPGEILWGELLDGLGFAMNREPMRRIARAVPLAAIEALLHALPGGSREAVARGVLFGVAGFLPLSPSEAHLGGLTDRDVSELESQWLDHGGPWRDEMIPATAWIRARVRPANHPVPRLLAAASLLASASTQGGTLARTLSIVLEGSDPIETLRALTGSEGRPGVGSDRAIDMLASGIIPLALALAAHSGDLELADAASSQWERLPAPSLNAVTRRAVRQVAGRSPLGRIGARGAQGLIHLDTVHCQPRRCFECPIAAAELSVNAVKG
ncbi:MAG: hypothetical protein K0Q71_6442 [Thermomicrobiales bacterium]|nr:hypothetical protein [Thermomicrobiales bacterium]